MNNLHLFSSSLRPPSVLYWLNQAFFTEPSIMWNQFMKKYCSLLFLGILLIPRPGLADRFWIYPTIDGKTRECDLLKVEKEKMLCYVDSVILKYKLSDIKTVTVQRGGEEFIIDHITEDQYPKLASALNNIYRQQTALSAQKAKHLRQAEQHPVFTDNSGIGLGPYQPNTDIDVKRVYAYKELLHMTYLEICDIYMYVIRNKSRFPAGYLSSVDSASKFVRLQNAEDRLDRAYEDGSVSSIMRALDDYGKAWVDNEMDSN